LNLINYYGAPASVLVASGKLKLVLCFTTYCKIVSTNRSIFIGNSLYQKIIDIGPALLEIFENISSVRFF